MDCKPAEFAPTSRTQVRRIPARGAYDRDTVHRILDEALICHVGFVDDGWPFVIPTIHTRVDDHIYLHGSNGSRMLRCAESGEPVCITTTLVDGLVLARSAFHHSMNYRSVVVLGRGREVTDKSEKSVAFDALVEHVIPGRSADARMPNAKEADGTKMVCVPIEEASVKIRTGPPMDDEPDYALPIWAGVIPLALTPGAPIRDDVLSDEIATPAYASMYSRPGTDATQQNGQDSPK